MKIPRDINYKELVKALKIYGYKVTRQTGGHLRLTTRNYLDKMDTHWRKVNNICLPFCSIRWWRAAISRHLNVGYDGGNILKYALLFSLFVGLFVFSGLIFAQDVLKEKITLLNSTTAAVRLSAIQSLARLQTNEAIDILVEHLKKEKDNYLKIQIIESLNVEASTVVFSAVVKAVYDKNPYVRQSAVRQLGYSSKPEKVLPVIEKLLKEEKNRSVKMTALNTLSLYKTATTVEIIDKILADKTADKDLRLLAVHSLGKIGTKEARNKLQKYLADTDPEVREKVKGVLKEKK